MKNVLCDALLALGLTSYEAQTLAAPGDSRFGFDPYAYRRETYLEPEARLQRCLELRRLHPDTFHQAAQIAADLTRKPEVQVRACCYQPDLWPARATSLIPKLPYAIGLWEEFAGAEPAFLLTLPRPVLEEVIPHLSNIFWLGGRWTPELQTVALDLHQPGISLPLLMMRGETEEVLLYLCAAEKKQGFAAVWAFLQGQRDEAHQTFHKLIARRRADTPVFEPWVALFARLTALSQGDLPLLMDPRLGLPRFPAANQLLDLIGRSLQQGKGAVALPYPPLYQRGLMGLLAWVLRPYLQKAPPLAADFQATLAAQGFSLMLDQLQPHPAHPWVAPTSQEAEWERNLRLLDGRVALAQGPSPASARAKSGALLWHLFPPAIVFYQDKKLGADDSPDDLSGKAISSKTLLNRLPDYLTEQDRIALGKIRLTPYGEAELSADVLRALIGHPRVYFKDRRVELQELSQQLKLEATPSGLKLRLHPALKAHEDYQIGNLKKGCLTFWTRSPVEKHLAPLIQEGLSFPREAEPQVRASLMRWLPYIDVECGPGLQSLQKSREQANQLRLRVRPATRGWRFDWVVRCQELSAYCRCPLEGPTEERVVEGQRVVVVERDLAAEQEFLERAWRQCPSLPPDTAFRLEDIETILDILQECRQAGITLEWPEGQPWRLRQSAKLRLSARQGVSRGVVQDWFAVEGDLQLDQGESLQLTAALSALRLGRGNYLQLGEHDFVRIDQELRSQLESLHDLVDAREMRLPALAVPSLAQLQLEGLSSDEAFQARLQKAQDTRDYSPKVPRTLQAELRDYQVEGFQWLARHARMGSGACLADDMGLGKTLQTLALMLHHRSDGPHLVVCPVSVISQWARQIEDFTPNLEAVIYEGKDRELKGLKAGQVVLLSYDILLRDAAQLSKKKWAVAVLDEAQAIKNPESKTARAAFQLQAGIRVATTGTPIENRLSELWSLFAFLNPGLLGSLASFRRRYESDSSPQKARLRALVAPFLLRRLKSQVLQELPPRTEISLQVELSPEERALYESVRLQAQQEMEGGETLQLLAHLTRLRQACCHPDLLMQARSGQSSSKLEALLELLDDLQAGRHRALVFSQFTSFLDLVEEALQRRELGYLRLDGSTPSAERRRLVEAFQAGEGEVFLISLKAGGTGLNLTGADYVVHLDPWWNPAAEDQASDRAHRIGQQRPVTIYRLIAANTIEEKVVQLHGHKRELAESVLEGREQATPLNLEELRQLLRMA